ncbi:hypothetical protein V8J82_07510 [Gymnodinialimonas sp. 2305UL16-5]|uniref:hypothetical protein n=1 Tax=Gymnodinialimonas mytili TaxID=3126503 RepID=UPI00309DC560
MPTCKVLLSLLGCLALAGCVGGGGGSAEAPRAVQVTSDLVTITGPRGYCVDPAATQNFNDTGFVLLGNCAAISGSIRAPQPQLPAILTAAVAGPSEGANLSENLDALDGFFRSEEGQRLLSRSGDPASVEILDTGTRGDIFLIHARDTSPGALPGVAQDYWRVYLDVGPRLATLSLFALADTQIDGDDAFATLTRFAAIVSDANRPGAAPAAPGAAELPQSPPDPSERPFPEGVFARIFR